MGNYNEFNKAVEEYDLKRWAEIQPILANPELSFSFGQRYEDVFVKWASLMEIHQRKIKDDVPAIYENLLALAKDKRFILLNVNDVFTDETILIIHSFLYYV